MQPPAPTLAIGTDHAGFPLKAPIVRALKERGWKVLDCGCDGEAPCDYPDFVRPAAQAVAEGRAQGAIVLGGSGNGEAMVANKAPGIRCGVCWNEWSARLTKEHNNANAIALGARVVEAEVAPRIVGVWLDAVFQGGRHQARIDKIEAPESA